MKCVKCKSYKDGMCLLAKQNRIGEIDDTNCLLRLLLIHISELISLQEIEVDDLNQGEEWKYDSSSDEDGTKEKD